MKINNNIAELVIENTPWNQLRSLASAAGLPVGKNKAEIKSTLLKALEEGKITFKNTVTLQLPPTEEKPFSKVLMMKTFSSAVKTPPIPAIIKDPPPMISVPI